MIAVFDLVRPYAQLMRVDKPKGTILVLWPFVYGLTLSAYETATDVGDFVELLLMFSLGAFLIRSVACTVNDIFDRDIDRQVERTKNRPLASGHITFTAAVAFALLQGFVCIALFSRLSAIAFHYGLFFLPLITIYPLMKRVTNWPQAWLGVAINWGAAVAWVTIQEDFDSRTLVSLSVGLWAWTVFYDTIYACQDRKDDARIGVGSTALAMDKTLKSFLSSMALVFVVSLAIVGVINNQGAPFFVLTVGGAALNLSWQLMVIDLTNPASCAQNFSYNAVLGFLVWSGMLVDYIFQAVSPKLS